MGFSWFIAKRLLQSGKGQKQLSTPIVRIAIGGIALGLCVMIVSVAIVTGFQREIRAKVIGFGAHLQVIKYDSNRSLEAAPIQTNEPWMQELKALPGLSAVYSVSRKPGIIKQGDAIEGVVFKGVSDPAAMDFFGRHLESGRLPNVNGPERSNEILLSSTLAKQLKLSTDSSLIMYFVQDPPKARKFTISGIYNTGLGDNDFDRVYVVGDERVVQQLNRWEPQQSGALEIMIQDFQQLNALNDAVYNLIPAELTSQSIEEVYPQIFGWLELMDTNVYIIITLMLVVSVINMVTSLLILILERVRMIGILKAMGADNRRISGLFLRQAAVLIATGMLIGNVVGLSLCLIQEATGWIKLNRETYYLTEVPIALNFQLILGLNLLTFAVCMLSMLLPSWMVSRFRPAKSLRWG